MRGEGFSRAPRVSLLLPDNMSPSRSADPGDRAVPPSPPPTPHPSKRSAAALSRYQRFVIGALAFLQFTVVLDFGVLAPLGPYLMPELGISTSQFGLAVSAYAFSACISGILSAGFADRFDRKRLLLIFYAGFLIGTVLCGIAPTHHFLIAARVVTGFFGGVIASISGAIVADLFPLELRGRAMGTIQSAFSASQVMGIPVGLFLASHGDWRTPFRALALLGLLVGVLIAWRLKPLTEHLKGGNQRHPLKHLLSTATNKRYMTGFAATMLVATGGFMLQPFASAFSVHNLGVGFDRLPMVFMISGTVGFLGGPLLGRLSDSVGKFTIFASASALSILYVLWYTGLSLPPLWLVIVANSFFAVLLAGRMATTMALNSAVPSPQDRGAYMAVSASIQQLSGGVAAWAAGLIVSADADGMLSNYNILGTIVAGAMIITLYQMYRVHLMIKRGAEAA